MENSKKAAEEVILGEEQLEAVVGGASPFALRASIQIESLFGKVQVARLDRLSLINHVVSN